MSLLVRRNAKPPLLLAGDLTYAAEILRCGQLPGVGSRRQLTDSTRKVLALAEQVLAELGRGRPAVIELAGEPGIGKTRLLRELAARAEASGQLVLAGSASELERIVPFSVFVDALDEYLAGLASARYMALDDDVQAELAHVFPSLSAQAADGEVALQHERYRSHRAVRDLLAWLAAARPLVLMLDDLHWADPASVELLGALLRRPPAAAVLLALAVRPRQMPVRLAAALERAQREAELTRVEFGALTPGEARELLGTTVTAAEAAALEPPQSQLRRARDWRSRRGARDRRRELRARRRLGAGGAFRRRGRRARIRAA